MAPQNTFLENIVRRSNGEERGWGLPAGTGAAAPSPAQPPRRAAGSREPGGLREGPRRWARLGGGEVGGEGVGRGGLREAAMFFFFFICPSRELRGAKRLRWHRPCKCALTVPRLSRSGTCPREASRLCACLQPGTGGFLGAPSPAIFKAPVHLGASDSRGWELVVPPGIGPSPAPSPGERALLNGRQPVLIRQRQLTLLISSQNLRLSKEWFSIIFNYGMLLRGGKKNRLWWEHVFAGNESRGYFYRLPFSATSPWKGVAAAFPKNTSRPCSQACPLCTRC